MSTSRSIAFECSPYSEVQYRWHPSDPRLPPRHKVAIPGIPVVYMFMSELINSGEDSEAQSNIYPNEFVNTLLPSGMPQHCLNLKV